MGILPAEPVDQGGQMGVVRNDFPEMELIFSKNDLNLPCRSLEATKLLKNKKNLKLEGSRS